VRDRVPDVATLSFTSNLRRHVDCPTDEVSGDTVAECLASYFERHPAVRSYVLDEQGGVRRHVAVFLDGEQIRDPAAQTDPVNAGGEITVMQALSGG
jgi:sulfur carrier protein ThiS